ncbi:MAG: hypothetical protein KatS3mg019_1110 [Fimbriimonadales bacterium]|nr:MAG: hypothetical protein KatS3mg019_1110 [Fimbriimonadales bacterium]
MQTRVEAIQLYREFGLASLIAPGLGHLLQGMPFRAMGWFAGAFVLWVMLFEGVASLRIYTPMWVLMIPLVAAYHCVSMYAAVRARQAVIEMRSPVEAALQALPPYLWKQAIGGALAVIGLLVLLSWTGQYADAAQNAMYYSSWRSIGWGQLLSQVILLWAIVGVGAWLFWQGRKEQEADAPRLRERILIAQAVQQGGVVAPAEASVALNITIHEARDYLEQLAREGLAAREETDGIIRYRLIP